MRAAQLRRPAVRRHAARRLDEAARRHARRRSAARCASPTAARRPGRRSTILYAAVGGRPSRRSPRVRCAADGQWSTDGRPPADGHDPGPLPGRRDPRAASSRAALSITVVPRLALAVSSRRIRRRRRLAVSGVVDARAGGRGVDLGRAQGARPLQRRRRRRLAVRGPLPQLLRPRAPRAVPRDACARRRRTRRTSCAYALTAGVAARDHAAGAQPRDARAPAAARARARSTPVEASSGRRPAGAGGQAAVHRAVDAAARLPPRAPARGAPRPARRARDGDARDAAPDERRRLRGAAPALQPVLAARWRRLRARRDGRLDGSCRPRSGC